MFKYEFLTLTQIGKVFSTTSHQVGRWLEEIGLRKDGKPSREAHEGKFCDTAPSRGQGYCWVWRAVPTVEALEKAGHRRASPPPLDIVELPRLNGPFTKRPAENGMTEIVGGDGTVTTFVLGDENAQVVCDLLNTGHRLNRLGTPARDAVAKTSPDHSLRP